MKTIPLVLRMAAFAAAISCSPQLVHAATTYYWDTTTTGLWTAGANWSNNAASGGTTGVAPTSTDSVVFNQGSVNGNETVQFGADATVAGITFANTGTTLLDSSSTTTRTLTITGGITVNSGAGAVTIGDSVNTLNVTLSQSSNTFTLNGATSLTFLNQTNITNTGASNNTLTLNGAGNTMTFNGLALNAGNKAGRVVAINGSANVAITGAVADGGSTAAAITYGGTGKLTLSGANTYTGITTITSGTMQFAKEASLYNGTTASWTVANIAVSSGATLAFNVGGTGEFTNSDVTTLITNIDRVVNGNGLKSGSFLGFDTTNAAGGAFTISDSIQNTTSTGGGSVGVTKLGTNTLVLSGANTYGGKTTISGGTLQFAKQTALYNNTTASWTATNVNVASGATVAFNVGGTGEFTTSNVTTLLSNLNGAVTSNGLQAGSSIGFDTTNASGGTFTISNVIKDTTGTGGGSVGVTKLGTGTLVLSGANTYTGATIVKGGSLALGASNALATGTAITLGGGTLNLSGFSQAAFTNALTMTAGSTIDFGSHVGGLTLTFGDSHSATWAGSLSLLDFTVGTDTLSFTSIAGLTVAQLSQISLAGYTATGLNASGNVQFTAAAIPEPATAAVFGGLAVFSLVALRRRRRG